MLLVASVAITAGGMYAVYQMYVKKKLQEDMRNVLEEYVPLNSAPDNSSSSKKFSVAAVPEFTAVSSLAPRLSISVSTPKVSDGAAATRFSQGSGQSGTPLTGGSGSANTAAGSNPASGNNTDLV